MVTYLGLSSCMSFSLRNRVQIGSVIWLDNHIPEAP